MNEQLPPAGIEWTRVWGRRGYTVNPIRGCTHECQWRMPDGIVATCYAKTLAEHSQVKRFYPKGFEDVTYHPGQLDALKKIKEPSGIFIDSMSDLFGTGTKPEWTQEILETVAKYPDHVFFSLTKNPPQLRKFQLPANLWCGVSAPATFMFGHELTPKQQAAWFQKAIESLVNCSARVRWISMEPLTMDHSAAIAQFNQHLDWAVVGAASRGRTNFQPDREVLQHTLDALVGTPVFFKGNISEDLANATAGRWLDNFPDPDSI